nr:MAG TPA: hypothetical protein [Caudoviricetes sp.]
MRKFEGLSRGCSLVLPDPLPLCAMFLFNYALN